MSGIGRGELWYVVPSLGAEVNSSIGSEAVAHAEGRATGIPVTAALV